jgi:hypothetical protein
MVGWKTKKSERESSSESIGTSPLNVTVRYGLFRIKGIVKPIDLAKIEVYIRQ